MPRSKILFTKRPSSHTSTRSLPTLTPMQPEGTIVFSTVGVSYYGFDVFSVNLSSFPTIPNDLTERRHTDCVSVNYNAQFLDDSNTVTFVSERSGVPCLYHTSYSINHPNTLPTIPESFFHDRPTIKNGHLYFVSNHESLPGSFRASSAVYSARLNTNQIDRLTPPSVADLSPAISRSGKLLAVASYGSEPWKGDFRELLTDIVVFPTSDPSSRSILCQHGGWPAWSGDSIVYFHRVAEDGWWSIYRAEVSTSEAVLVSRVTPPGLHAFTPAASHDGKYIAVATRRKGRITRQIEIFDIETEQFHSITELINPEFHHYNPFFSPDSSRLGYHRFRGESAPGDSVIPHLHSVIPHLHPVRSPVSGLRMLRTHYTFPAFSSAGNLIAVNGDLQTTAGLMIIRSDGTKRWTLLEEPAVFYTAWSPVEKGVIFVSMGPIFQSQKATVQIARITFDPDDLTEECDKIPAEAKILTCTGTGNNAFPSCSPDGRELVFRSGRSGHKNLYILDAVNGELEGGGGIRKLTDGEWIDTMPCWSPDSKLIAFSSNRHNPKSAEGFGLYIVRPDGTELRRVVVAESDSDRERINHVCFSPDSKWLLFTANLGGVSAEPVSMPNHFQPYGDLYICRLDGTGLRRLTYNAYENGTPAWYSSSDAPEIGSLSLQASTGDKLRGNFDEPLWINCEL